MIFPCQGHFWLPGRSGEPVFGTLTFNRRDGGILLLTDTLPGSGDEPESEIILGQTAGGAFVTLLRGIRTVEPLLRLTRISPCSYHAPLLITGAAIDNIADLRFSVWQVRVPELSAWVQKNGIEVEPYSLDSGNDCPTLQINYKTPQKQVLLSNADGLHLSLAFWPLLRTNPDVAAIRQQVCLEIRQSPSSDTLEEYMKTATRFEHLLTLATGDLVRTGSIKAVVRAEGQGSDARSGLVDILYQPIRNGNGTLRSQRRREQLFTLPDLAGREQEYLGNWFTKAEWLDPVCDLYFGTLYNPSKYLDFNFLALVQAVEAYHRRSSDATDKPFHEHEARIRTILDAVPLTHRDWLQEKLQHSNELSLRSRLKLLFTQFAYLLDELVPDRKATINAIYENRNFLTHYDPKFKGRVLTGARLLLMVELLKLVIQACFLREIGLSDVAIAQYASRSRTVRVIRYLTRRLAQARA